MNMHIISESVANIFALFFPQSSHIPSLAGGLNRLCKKRVTDRQTVQNNSHRQTDGKMISIAELKTNILGIFTNFVSLAFANESIYGRKSVRIFRATFMMNILARKFLLSDQKCMRR